jgi:hypothetical protein
MGSNLLKTVVFVPLAKVLVKLGTGAQIPFAKFELNCGISFQVVLVPVDVITMFVPTWIIRIVFLGGTGEAGALMLICPKNE